MKRQAGLVVIAVSLMVTARVSAREYDSDISVESPEELYDLLSAGEIEQDDADLLVALMQNPLDLNRADARLLYELPQVTTELAEAIVAYRGEHGAYAQLQDLMNVPGMTTEILNDLSPFVSVQGVVGNGELSQAAHARVRLGSIYRRGFGKDRDKVTNDPQYDPQYYLIGNGAAFDYFNAGFLTTWRQRTRAHWSTSRGELVSSGPDEVLDLDNVFFDGTYGPWSAIAGTYDAGFGQRLTFDTSVHKEPHGWYELNTLYEDNETGRIRPSTGLFGGAVSLSGADLPLGWLDATAFASTQKLDSYQYRGGIWFDVDNYDVGDGTCETDGDCPDGYSCGNDNMCHTSKVFDTKDPNKDYRYVTFKDSYRESLFGGNVTYNLNDETHFGLTAYRSYLDILLGEEAHPRFSPSAIYPEVGDTFGAVGIDGRTVFGPLVLAGEYAQTSERGHGAFGRAVWDVIPSVELAMSLRYYGPWFENPHGRADAARDEVLGLTARNEQGFRLEATIMPLAGLRTVTIADFVQHPYVVGYGDDGKLRADVNKKPPTDLHAVERVMYSLTDKEHVGLELQYDNHNLSKGGRDEFYDDTVGDSFEDLMDETKSGNGERRAMRAFFGTRSVPRTSITASARYVWEDIQLFDKKFMFSQLYRLRAGVAAWHGAFLVASAAYYVHDQTPGYINESDRDSPVLSTFVDLRQRINEDFAIRARYGLLHFYDERPDHFDWYQLGKLSVEGRF